MVTDKLGFIFKRIYRIVFTAHIHIYRIYAYDTSTKKILYLISLKYKLNHKIDTNRTSGKSPYFIPIGLFGTWLEKSCRNQSRGAVGTAFRPLRFEWNSLFASRFDLHHSQVNGVDQKLIRNAGTNNIQHRNNVFLYLRFVSTCCTSTDD